MVVIEDVVVMLHFFFGFHLPVVPGACNELGRFNLASLVVSKRP